MQKIRQRLSGLFEDSLNKLSLEWVIPLFSLVLIAMIWVSVLMQVNSDYLRNRREMLRQSENMVRVFEEHISRTARAVDQSVLFLNTSLSHRA